MAFTDANAVPATQAEDVASAITVNAKKPTPDCAAITVTVYLAGAGTINGANAAELITGSAGVDTMDGRNGNDCIVGGGGNDAMDGGGGTDVCIGGPGTDTFNARCETQIQ